MRRRSCNCPFSYPCMLLLINSFLPSDQEANVPTGAELPFGFLVRHSLCSRLFLAATLITLQLMASCRLCSDSEYAAHMYMYT